MIVSWINRTIDLKVASSLPFYDSARALWLCLEKRFCVANGPRLQQLRAQITDCRQSKSMSVEDYYTKLMGLYDELDILKPLHHCTCGLCTCGLVDKFCSDRDEERLHQFYIGIDDDLYGVVRTNLLCQTPSPDLDRAYQTFLQEERSRAIARTKPPEVDTQVFAFPTDRNRPRPKPNDVDKSTLVCSYYKKQGHDRSGCFDLHGKPAWWYERYGNSKTSPSTSVANSPKNRTAHAHALPSNNYFGPSILPLPPSPVAHSSLGPDSTAHYTSGPAVQYSSSAAQYTPVTPPNYDSSPVGPNCHSHTSSNSVSSAQVHNLLTATPSPKLSDDRIIGKPSCFEWIIDSGASHHVTGNYSCLFNVICISEWTDGLPDGRHVSITLSGCVRLSSTIILSHVVYVPSLSCNLISVSRLIDDGACLVRFTNTLCAI
ncbi:Retrovirus-related Pol polyprotein from transposon RE1 [Bienertia sinuspersici]